MTDIITQLSKLETMILDDRMTHSAMAAEINKLRNIQEDLRARLENGLFSAVGNINAWIDEHKKKEQQEVERLIIKQEKIIVEQKSRWKKLKMGVLKYGWKAALALYLFLSGMVSWQEIIHKFF